MKKNLSLKTLMKEVSRWFMKDDQTWIFSSFINKGSVDCVTLLLRDIATPKVKTRFLLFSIILHNKTITQYQSTHFTWKLYRPENLLGLFLYSIYIVSM